MKSMTGYAYTEQTIDQTTVCVELKSYNSRYLDLSIHLPSWLGRIEPKIREMISETILRGKVEVSLRIREQSSSLVISSDPGAANPMHMPYGKLRIPSMVFPPACRCTGRVLSSERVVDMDGTGPWVRTGYAGCSAIKHSGTGKGKRWLQILRQ